ncbi:MAG: hypothetical protein Kow0069_22680 [Promethearchaeota archaeon]
MAEKKKRRIKLAVRMITCKKCGWSFTNKQTACPSCGTPIGFPTPKELVEIMQFYVDLQGLWVSPKEAKQFIKDFKKKNKRWPTEMDLAIAADDYVQLQRMGEAELRAKEKAVAAKAKEEKKKKKKERKEKVKEVAAVELDIEAKMRELQAKRAAQAQAPEPVAPAATETSALSTKERKRRRELVEPASPAEVGTVVKPAAPARTTAAPPVAPSPTSAAVTSASAATPAGGELACPKCGHANPPDSRFCLECGNKLGAAPPTAAPASAPAAATPAGGELACPKCGHANPPDSRFCLECGNKLA